MNYFVVGHDGTEYGPVDLATLTQWALEQRILKETKLIEAETKRPTEAYLVEGIIWPPKNPDVIKQLDEDELNKVFESEQYSFTPQVPDDQDEKINEMDGFFWNSSIAFLIFGTICFSPVALFIGLVGCFTCQDPDARKRAIYMTLGSLAINAIFVIVSELNKLK